MTSLLITIRYIIIQGASYTLKANMGQSSSDVLLVNHYIFHGKYPKSIMYILYFIVISVAHGLDFANL